MNLVKAADDLKNLSDQQLMVAGQNPVAVPPYLVLAEMKRREQLRAEYAKAQQGQQQQQPPVIQQVAQNLAQGQPQQQQPQAQPNPQAQGIMQAMPQGAMGMAGGGHVARYADKGRVVSPAQPSVDPLLADLMKKQSDIYAALSAVPSVQPTQRPDLVLSQADIERQYKGKSPLELMGQAESLYGKGDYSAYENFLRGQMEEAKSRKVGLSDVFTAGAREMGKFDPRETFAGKLARGIMGATEAIRTGREQKKKDIQTAMLAQVALDKMKREEQQQRATLAMNLAQMDSGRLLTMLQTLEANKRSMAEDLRSEKRESEQRRLQIGLAQANATQGLINSALQHQSRMSEIGAQLAGQKDIARISAGARAAVGSRDITGGAIDDLRQQSKDIMEEIKWRQEQLPMLKKEDRPAAEAMINQLNLNLNQNRRILGSITASRINPDGSAMQEIPRMPTQGTQK